jgi:hypothetical protein
MNPNIDGYSAYGNPHQQAGAGVTTKQQESEAIQSLARNFGLIDQDRDGFLQPGEISNFVQFTGQDQNNPAFSKILNNVLPLSYNFAEHQRLTNTTGLSQGDLFVSGIRVNDGVFSLDQQIEKANQGLAEMQTSNPSSGSSLEGTAHDPSASALPLLMNLMQTFMKMLQMMTGQVAR